MSDTVSRREALVVAGAAGMAMLSHHSVDGQEKKPTDKPKTITVVTNGKIGKVKGDEGKEVISVTFEKTDDAKTVLVVGTADKPASVQRFALAEGQQFTTNGAVVESKGQDGALLLEIIGIDEFKHRYPKLVEKNPKLASAAGFCSLFGPPYYCKKSTCTGSCTLHNIPVYCSCG